MADIRRYYIQKGELRLRKWRKLNHYLIVVFFIVVPFIVIFSHVLNYFNDNLRPVKDGEITFMVVCTILAVFFYWLQKRRLKFKVVETDLSRKKLGIIIEKVAKDLEWNIHQKSESLILAKTNPGFFSPSWGEQITIIFDENKLLVNSICDLDKRSSVISMGRNSRNMNRLIEEVKLASDLQSWK